LATQIVIFLFAKEVTGSHMWGIVPVAFYGATMAFFDTTVFIRMYPLLTLFTVLLAWKHYHIIKNPEKRSAIVWCFAITFLGVFTQYYFAIVAFFMAVAMCVRMLCRRDWKTVLIYCDFSTAYVAYPAASG
ncbi:MAG: hypothetical protein Q4B04_02060, partial [bacterium]|nr:hypothetical protein [bacterium]